MPAARSALTILIASFAFSLPALATSRVLVVLPLDISNAEGKMTPGAQAAIEEMLRDVAVDKVGAAGWTVLTGETTLQVLKDNGVNPAQCGDQTCHLTMAREIKAEKFISGSVQFSDEEFTASIRLVDSESGRIMASARLAGATSKALRKEFESTADDFFSRGGLSGTAPVAAPAAPPAPTTPTVPAAPKVEAKLAPAPASPMPVAAPTAAPAKPAADAAYSFAARATAISASGFLGGEFEFRPGLIGVAVTIGAASGLAVTVGNPGMRPGFFGSLGASVSIRQLFSRSGAANEFFPALVAGYEFRPIPHLSVIVGVGAALFLFDNKDGSGIEGFKTVLPWGRAAVGYAW